MAALPLLLALAASQASPAESRLAEAKAMLSQLEDKKAAEAAENGLKLSPPEAVAAQLLVTLGLARFNLLDTEGARRAFRAAVVADEKIAPPEDANPRAVALFGEARAEIRQATATPAWRFVGIALAGIAVAALGTGAGLGASSQLARSQAVSDPSAESAQAEMTVARGRATAANWLFAVGGVLAVAGGTLALWPATGGAAISYRTNF